MHILDILFAIVWIVVGFFVVRFAGQRFFHEKHRADVAAAAIVVAFAIGALWPFLNRTVSNPTVSNPIANATPGFVCHSPSPRKTIISGMKQAQGGDYRGHIDSLRAETESDRPTPDFRAGCNIYANGWAVDMNAKTTVPGIGFVIDSKSQKVINGTRAYGQKRTDVAQVLNAPRAAASGFFQAEIDTVGLRRGLHTIQLVTLSKDRKWYHLVGSSEPFTLR